MKLNKIILSIVLLLFFLFIVYLQRFKGASYKKQEEPFSFIVVGHVYPQYEALENIVKKAEEQGVAFIVLTGDMINGEPKSLEERWDIFLKIMNKNKIPFYIAPGNHDVGTKENKRVFEQKIGSTFGSFIYKNNKFILLNSCDYQNDFKENISLEQLDFLKREYQDPWEFNHIFLFVHHPLWLSDFSLSNGSYKENNWQAEVYPLIKEKTKYVFAGDSYTFFYTFKDGIYYLVNGLSGSSIRDVPHFLLIQVQGKEIKISLETALPEAENKIYLFKEKS